MADEHRQSQNPDARPRTRVSFYLVGEALDLDEVTERLCLHPTRAGRRGERSPGMKAPWRETSWMLQIDRRTYDLDEAVAELLDVIWPHREAVTAFLALPGVETHVSCTVEVFEESVILGLGRRSVERMAALGAAVGLDYYDYREADAGT